MFDAKFIGLIGTGLLETFFMTALSTVFSYLIGLPLGVILSVTSRAGIKPDRRINAPLGALVNVLRSVPFIILMVAVIPFTRFIVGTSVGSAATVVPLVIATFPVVARSVEASVSSVDRGIIEAAQSMGASVKQLVLKVLLPEALPSLIAGAAGCTITALGYSAMAGAVGGGGLGAIAINYGYYRGQTGIMYVMVILLVLIVQALQETGSALSLKNDRTVSGKTRKERKNKEI